MDQNQDQEQEQQQCQMCNVNPRKYTCPRCSIHTCSVDCVKRHKQENKCSGERDKTSFVSRDKYNYSHMMSDYTYLEDISRRSDTLTRERYKAPAFMDNRSKLIMKKAREMGIQYNVLPAIMTRHKSNKTSYNNNTHQMYWTVECCFHRNNTVQKILEYSIPQAKTIRGMFENMLFVENPQGKVDYNTIRYQARDFKDAGMDQLVIGLKKEGAPKNTFVNLTSHLDRTIRDILRGEKVIEFPTLYIWLQGQLDGNVILEEKVFVEHHPRPNKRLSKDQQSENSTTTEKDKGDDDTTKNEATNSNEQPLTTQADERQEAATEEEMNNINKNEEVANTEEPLLSPSKIPLTSEGGKDMEEHQLKDDKNNQSEETPQE
ncbi:hypothetical protein BDC45DRAFT_497136 [Circinella umbellata]|nr:hypothetical protein BDC45DRAFT_497136 [Circinella umbellata]